MGLFGKAKKSDGALPGTALVVDATAPAQGAPRWGGHSKVTVRILVDPGTGPVQLTAEFPATEQHWLVRGMDIAVWLDPARPAEFTVDWDAIPGMAQRAAANDPALADPIAASRRVAHALGLTRADTGSARADRFAALLATAAGTSGTPGFLRAVVLVATIRGRYYTTGSPDGPTGGNVTMERSSAAVLAVQVPGRAPYALYLPKFKFPKMREDLTGGGLPALVSTVDPSRVDIQWDETPSVQQRLADRIASGLAAQQQRNQQFGWPAPGPTAVPAQMRQMMVANLRRSLAYVADPTQRAMIVDQYRAMGLDIRPEELL
jgi:hypothetical protein